MGMLDELPAQAGGNVDIGAIAGKLGVDPAMAQSALGQLLPQIADQGVNNAAAVADVAGKTGLDAGALGSVPVAGAVFDVCFRSNSRNLELIKTL